MIGDFFERMEFLKELVGHGELVGHVTVDQKYAHWIEVHPEFRHRQGGQAFYLQSPLFAHFEEWLRVAVLATLDEEIPLRDGMIVAMEHLSDEVERLAPREFHILRYSGEPDVFDDGEEVYDRPPIMLRLSDEELKAMKEAGVGLEGPYPWTQSEHWRPGNELTPAQVTAAKGR